MRRRFHLVLFLLALGVLLNVAVAWSLEIAHPFRGREYHKAFLADEDAEAAGWLWSPPDHWSAPVLRDIEARTGALDASAANVPRAGPILLMAQGDRGWPLLALRWRGAHELREDGTERWNQTLSWWESGVGVPNPLSPRQMAVLPMSPLWPGFVVNSIFYAGTAWLLLLTTRVSRRRLRARRGLCTVCKYPITGHTVCPECGNPTPTNAAPSAPRRGAHQ